MAPIKFEEDIKSVLEKRTIAPSKMAWEELEKTLEKTSKPTQKKPYWWIGIAASVVGILWISISVFNNDEVIIEPTIVDAPNDKIEIPTRIIPTQKEEKTEQVAAIKKSNYSTNKELIAVEIPSKKVNKKTVPENESHQNQQLEKEILITNVYVEPSENISSEEKQLLEIVAQVAALEKENATDAEIDLLLKNAQHKIANQKFKESGMSVSAYALLFEVEEELDPTFKEKVFNILSENYHSVKNAVAQRND
ncbi:MAG: hypothetical protein COB73_02385 [Flavobacteriaceae bacterium]|nr:MAG: hypothetical protein COB73_02385 [Flavobacteriaceae bacterium]